MPNPTTNPKPSPKPPPVCKKGPKKVSGPPQPPYERLLNALVGGLTAGTGLQAAISANFYLYPLITPYHWANEQQAGGYLIDLAVFKNPTDDRYAIEIAFYVGPTPFFSKQWHDVEPRTQDPLEFPDLTYKDPLTGDQATVTIVA